MLHAPPISFFLILQYKNTTSIQDLFQGAIYLYDFSIVVKDTKIICTPTIHNGHTLNRSQNSSACVVTRLSAGLPRNCGPIPGKARDFTVLKKYPDQFCGPFSLLFKGYLRASHARLKWIPYETDQSTPSVFMECSGPVLILHTLNCPLLEKNVKNKMERQNNE
jgi:hypothetical protein